MMPPIGSEIHRLTNERIQDLIGFGDPTEQECRLIRMGWNAALATTGAALSTAGAAKVVVSSGPERGRYRLLERGVDTIQAGDEFLRDDGVTWQTYQNGIFVGMTYQGDDLLPARRAIVAHGITDGQNGGTSTGQPSHCASSMPALQPLTDAQIERLIA